MFMRGEVSGRILGDKVAQEALNVRIANYANKGFGKTKWIEFCEVMLKSGFTLHLYESKSTVSKYITVSDPKLKKKGYRVRFSNHKPIPSAEVRNSCDFFVGITNLGITNTDQAIEAVMDYFNSGKGYYRDLLNKFEKEAKEDFSQFGHGDLTWEDYLPAQYFQILDKIKVGVQECSQKV